MIDDAHYPPRPAGPLARRPKPTSAAEAGFLALGEGARLWLVDLVVERPDAAVLVEAKATATPSASLLAGATRVSRHLADSFAATDVICVYGGDTAQQRRDGQLIPWRRLHHPDTGRRLLA